MSTVAPNGLSPDRVIQLAKWPVAIALTVAFIRVAPLWAVVLIPRWFVRGATIGFLWSVAALFAIVLALAPLGVPALAIVFTRARLRGKTRSAVARWLMLGVTCLVGAALLEAGAGWIQAMSRRRGALPTRFATAPTDGEISLVVIGESSAEGQPYQGWLSVAKIVAWQLEQALPGKRIVVDNRSDGGICLDQAITYIEKLERRPDIVMIYSGHNEYTARFGWSRVVRYYRDEVPHHPWPVRALNVASGYSTLMQVIREALERHTLDVPPPPRATRELVDHPAYSREEHDFLLSHFESRLETVLAWCERVGALPIVIIPPGNDGGFPPNRSVLPADTSEPERDHFAKEFLAARAAEPESPKRAREQYEALIARYPSFAETHFRLALNLARSGNVSAANEHFIRARDLDNMPFRCTSEYQAAIRKITARHDVELIDGPRVFQAASPHGICDDHLIHDAQHPNLFGYIALAEKVIERLIARPMLARPKSIPPPRIDPAECAAHFGIDRAAWATIVDRCAFFYARTAYVRFDPSESLARGHRYFQAHQAITSGTNPIDAGVLGLGLNKTSPCWLEDRNGDGNGDAARNGAGAMPLPPS